MLQRLVVLAMAVGLLLAGCASTNAVGASDDGSTELAVPIVDDRAVRMSLKDIAATWSGEDQVSLGIGFQQEYLGISAESLPPSAPRAQRQLRDLLDARLNGISADAGSSMDGSALATLALFGTTYGDDSFNAYLTQLVDYELIQTVLVDDLNLSEDGLLSFRLEVDGVPSSWECAWTLHYVDTEQASGHYNLSSCVTV